MIKLAVAIGALSIVWQDGVAFGYGDLKEVMPRGSLRDDEVDLSSNG